MVCGESHFFRKNLALASVVLLGLSTGLAITAPLPTFADETTTTSTGGGSDGSANASGQGASAGTVDSNTNSQAASGDNGGAAGTATDAASQATQQGPDGQTNAGAGTVATAGVTADGSKLTADAAAAATAGAGSSTDTGLAGAASVSEASAHAENGDAPKASTQAGSDTYASAVGGDNRVATAVANGLNQVTQTHDGKWRTVTIAYSDDGNYSVAIATKWRATAFSSTYGSGGAVTADQIFAAAKTSAQAYATAGKDSASAWAQAHGWSASGNQFGASSAASVSRAGAELHIEITKTPVFQSPNSHSSVTTTCNAYVTDWQKWKTASTAERMRLLRCVCPQNAAFSGTAGSCGVVADVRAKSISISTKPSSKFHRKFTAKIHPKKRRG